MTSYSNRGFFNHAYHDNETLEMDRRASSKTHHTNPYAKEDPTCWGDRASSEDAIGRVPQGGWQEESWRGRENIPMDTISIHPRIPSLHHGPNHSRFGMDPTSGNMTMRWRGIAMRRMSMFPNADHTQIAFTEDAIRNEMENEQQKMVEELAALSTRDRIQAIRDLPMSFKEKKQIRKELELQSSKKTRQFTCLTDCSERLSLFSRKCGYRLKSAQQTLELWQGAMKNIGGKFGTSVLTYFVFLKWLLVFNIFSFLVNFGFVTIPLLVYKHTPNISQNVNNVPENVTFRGLEILTGAGYFNYTVMYYGSYSNETLVGLVGYNMQLAYFFTIAVYMVLCGISLIFSMAINFKNNYVLADSASNSAWQLLCTWDFSVTNEKAVKQRRNNLCVQLKESLSENAQQERLPVSEKLKLYGIHFGCWLLSTSLAVGCAASIHFLCNYEHEQATMTVNWSLLEEAKTLLVPFVVSLMNLVIPLFYSLFNKFEHYSTHRKQIYALLIRNVFLKMSILSVLCYHWLNVVSNKDSCWESMVGQSLYRLVFFDFLFLMLGSFFGEFLSNVIGSKLIPRMGVPEFDVARNVLELIYSQTLAWIGIYFSPLLPAMQILKFFILFYLKKVSLTHNCQPPRRSGRAAQMQTLFIFLLFFPFFVGALSIVAYTAWSLTPSEDCGPFRGLNNSFSVVGVWIGDLKSDSWVVWIYDYVIRSEIFYFLITLIILVIIYILWQVTNGRKELIRRLRQQIVNEGKDKSFLLERLQLLQRSLPNKNTKQMKQKGSMKQHSDDRSSGDQSNSNAMVQALLARQQLEEEGKRYSIGGVPVPSEMSNSSPLVQAMLARQLADQENEDLYPLHDENPLSSSALAQAMAVRHRLEDEENNEYDIFSRSSAVTQAMQARRRADGLEDDMGDRPSPVSSVMMQVMQARQQAEENDRIPWMTAPPQNPGPSGSSALIQAMLARQEAQNEYDDGY